MQDRLRKVGVKPGNSGSSETAVFFFVVFLFFLFGAAIFYFEVLSKAPQNEVPTTVEKAD